MKMTLEDGKIVEKLVDVWDVVGPALGEVQVTGETCEVRKGGVETRFLFFINLFF